jgi:hypothetical protein
MSAIVQIAAAASYHPSLPDILYGLAADGTVWRLVVKLGNEWQQLPSLPEPAETTPTQVPVP